MGEFTEPNQKIREELENVRPIEEALIKTFTVLTIPPADNPESKVWILKRKSDHKPAWETRQEIHQEENGPETTIWRCYRYNLKRELPEKPNLVFYSHSPDSPGNKPKPAENNSFARVEFRVNEENFQWDQQAGVLINSSANTPKKIARFEEAAKQFIGPRLVARRYNRRAALAIGAAAAGAALAGCAPALAPESPGSPTVPTQSTQTPASIEIPPSPSPIESPTESQENLENNSCMISEKEYGIYFNVNGSERSLTGNQFMDKQNSATTISRDYPNRHLKNVEFLVGSGLWHEWQNNPEETFTHFMARHVQRFNQMLSQTRPESSLEPVAIAPHINVYIVDEGWLQNQPYHFRQMIALADTDARWSFDQKNCDPRQSGFYHEDFEGNKYDDGLFHEWCHYFLFLGPHLPDYFLDHFLSLSKINYQNAPATGELLIWQKKLMADQFENFLLSYASLHFRNKPNNYPLAQTEEWFLRRVLENGTATPDPAFRQIDEWSLNNQATTEDLAPSYHLTGTGISNPALTIAKINEVEVDETVHYLFDREPVALQTDENGILLPAELISGGSEMTDGNQSSLPKAFIFSWQDSQGQTHHAFFTGYHLAYWHYLEQIKHGEARIGKNGNAYPVTIPLSDFEPQEN